ncbi:NHS-like protein 1 isoform 1 [Cricetulus griseus]|uniref:NHS-like protein 1 isoform 1 n=1 Tax=Cricetulus griseus TaxID=10029 RepID=A0A061IF12_CRIGR|nr:NHS-like protein 1 isoform 1 [Cricetulus griseus]
MKLGNEGYDLTPKCVSPGLLNLLSSQFALLDWQHKGPGVLPPIRQTKRLFRSDGELSVCGQQVEADDENWIYRTRKDSCELPSGCWELNLWKSS